MTSTNRLPRFLQRLTEVGIVISAVIAVVVVVAVFFADTGLESPIEFTPDEDTYSLSSDEWGTGTIEGAVGLVRFTESGPVLAALTAARVLIYAAASIVMLVLVRGILRAVADGQPFALQNTNRLRAIGILIPVFGFLLQGFDWVTALITMNVVDAQGLHIEANLSPNLTYLFIGLVIVAVAQAFHHGTDLQVDADLTV